MDFNISDLMNQAKKLQDEMKLSKEKLKDIKVEGEAGGGMVKVTLLGDNSLINIEIEDRLIDNKEKEMLENLIVAAVNNGIQKVQEAVEKEMGSSATDMLSKLKASGINFPGM